MSVMHFVQRPFDADIAHAFVETGVHPVIARVLSARGICCDDLKDSLRDLYPPFLLENNEAAGECIAQAIMHGKRIVVVGDYDCDGATASAVAVRGLTLMKADVQYVVPNRFTMQYGLSKAIIDVAMAQFKPDVIITVDNGITSVEAVAYAKKLGLTVIVTDHHMPGCSLPPADVIVNPNCATCSFPSKSLSGTGVMFYVLLSTRIALRRCGFLQHNPHLGALLDLVAVGTIADTVQLDRNNRILVAEGLNRIRAGRMQVGLRLLLEMARCDAQYISTSDIGYVLAPRINAAGRMLHMSVAIDCLITDEPTVAQKHARELERLNRQRRLVEQRMQQDALLALAECDPAQPGSVLYDSTWHIGLVGLIANRVKEHSQKPSVIFAPSEDGLLHGSARSTEAVDLYTVLQHIHEQDAQLLIAFGGHPHAAGLTIAEKNLVPFTQAFYRLLSTAQSTQQTPVLHTDGGLSAADFTPSLVDKLGHIAWGRGFERPVFCNFFAVERFRALGTRHLAFTVCYEGIRLQAYQWHNTVPPLQHCHMAYHLTVDFFCRERKVSLTVLEKEEEKVSSLV